MIKRLCDILFSAIGLLLLLPVFIVIIILVKIDSAGPSFYLQTRIGRQGRPFQIIKFRTMLVNADRQGLLTTDDNDSRITRLGKVLRKYKLDELPQLLNVLRGDMSFVGPRPEVQQFVKMYTPEQMHVLDVRPGITDAASIKYRNENALLARQDDPERYYIEVIMPDKLAINLDYVQHHTLLGDLKLILQTLQTILNR